MAYFGRLECGISLEVAHDFNLHIGKNMARYRARSRGKRLVLTVCLLCRSISQIAAKVNLYTRVDVINNTKYARIIHVFR